MLSANTNERELSTYDAFLATQDPNVRAAAINADAISGAIHPASVAVLRFLRERVVAPLARLQRRNELFRELDAMDDHLLADIGIPRGQIPFYVEKVLAPKPAAGETETGATVHHLPVDKSEAARPAAEPDHPLAA